ncbi:hypothetical protein G7Y89_g12410 [Cudoniella acicularis]|uniref:Uncharacterized protein n=1 Tax=Cudoniella acicularis TaxID=354080 RepID=A0A8H4VZ72_9HELO|nr:hypothetical protein G7Y89_g12410 [Cudoniella acicularis]
MSLKSDMGKSPPYIPLIFTNLPLQTQHRKNDDLSFQNNNTVESQLNQQESKAWKLPPLGASESPALVKTYRPHQDMIQKSDSPELPQYERVTNDHFHLFLAEHFYHESLRACEPTCPDCPGSVAYLSVSPVEVSFKPYTSRCRVTAWKDDMEISLQEYLNKMRSRISDNLVGIGAQFWPYNDTGSCEPFTFPE